MPENFEQGSHFPEEDTIPNPRRIEELRKMAFAGDAESVSESAPEAETTPEQPILPQPHHEVASPEASSEPQPEQAEPTQELMKAMRELNLQHEDVENATRSLTAILRGGDLNRLTHLLQQQPEMYEGQLLMRNLYELQAPLRRGQAALGTSESARSLQAIESAKQELARARNELYEQCLATFTAMRNIADTSRDPQLQREAQRHVAVLASITSRLQG